MKTYCWCASSVVSDEWIAFLACIMPLFRGIMSDDLSLGRIRPPSSRIDIEAVRRERIQSLKNSRRTVGILLLVIGVLICAQPSFTGVTADLDPPGPNPLADMDPPFEDLDHPTKLSF